MGLVFDTSALIVCERALAAGRVPALDRAEALVLPAIVWAEALIGVRLADTPLRAAQRRARLEALRATLVIEPFTPAIAEHYADIFAELTSAGTMIPQNDLAVAATARALGLGVLVGANDEAHFRCVRELRVVRLDF